MKDLSTLKTVKELRELSSADLSTELKDVEKALFSSKMGIELNTQRQTHVVKVLRRYIAKIKTVAAEIK